MGIKTKERHRQSEEEKMRHRLQPSYGFVVFDSSGVFVSFFYASFLSVGTFFGSSYSNFSFDLIREWSSYLKIGLCFLVVIMFVNVFWYGKERLFYS